MELEVLLEEHAELLKRIQHSLESIEIWFEKKMEQGKEIFSETKEKVLAKFSKVSNYVLKGKVIKEDIKIQGNKVVAKKGENAVIVFNRIKVMIKNILTTLKLQCDKIIISCQKGLRCIAGISDEQLAERNLIIIEEHKKSVIQEINDTASTVVLITNLLSCVGIITYTAINVNKVLNNINKTLNKSKDVKDKSDSIEAEYSYV